MTFAGLASMALASRAMIPSRTKSTKQAAGGQFTGVIEGWLLGRDFPNPDNMAVKSVAWWLPRERGSTAQGHFFRLAPQPLLG
jgi:hypothetical protein